MGKEGQRNQRTGCINQGNQNRDNGTKMEFYE